MNKVHLLKYRVVTPNNQGIYLVKPLTNYSVLGGIKTTILFNVAAFSTYDRFFFYLIDNTGATEEKGLPSWLSIELYYSSTYTDETSTSITRTVNYF